MTAARCIAAMSRAAGRELTDDEMIEVAERLERRVDRLRRQRGSASDADLYRQAADDLREEHNRETLLRRRSTAISLQRFAELNGFIGQYRDPAVALEALMVGVNARQAGGRFSVDYRGKAIANEDIGGLIARLRAGAPGDALLQAFRSGALDEMIVAEMWAMPPGRAPAGGGVSGNADAFAIAAAVHDAQEAQRQRMNRAGAWIDALPGYVMRQQHHPRALVRAGYDQWRDAISPLLDERTFDRHQGRVDQVTGELRTIGRELTGLSGDRERLTAGLNQGTARLAQALRRQERSSAQADVLRAGAGVPFQDVPEGDTVRARAGAEADEAAARHRDAAGQATAEADEMAAAQREQPKDPAGDFTAAIGEARQDGRINAAQADALERLARRIRRMGEAKDERRLVVLEEKLRRDYDRALATLDATARQATQIEPLLGRLVIQLDAIADRRRALEQRQLAAERAEKDLRGAGAVADREAFLRTVYDDIVTGRVVRPGDAYDWVPGIGGNTNLAQSVSRERVLHFRDAQAWWTYHRAFGKSGLADGVLEGLTSGGRHTAMLETFGPNPQAMFERIVMHQAEQHHGDRDALRELRSFKLRNQFDYLTGEALRTERMGLATAGAAVRGFNIVTKLGQMMLSSIGDTATYASEAQFQGRGHLTPYAEAIANLVRGRGSGETRRVLDLLGAGLEGMTGMIGARWGANDGPAGLVSSMVQRFFVLAGQSWWTDAHKSGASLMTSRAWALDRGLGWDALDGHERNLMQLYRIGAGEWDVFRALPPERAGDREYMIPAALRNAPHAAIESYAARQLQPLEAQRIRDQLADRFQTLLADRADYAVPTPGVREQAMMYGGHQPGTGWGETLRLFWQFKAFPVSVLTKPVGRTLYGAESAAHAAGGFASLFLQLTAMGYVAMSAKDLVKGKEPRDPTRWQTWLAAMVQGGGAGLYGDFLFGEFNRFGRSAAETIAGPTFGGIVPDVAELWAKSIRGETKVSDVIRFGAANTPFANLFYVKPLIDYALLYPLYDSLKPGYLRRLERRIEQQNNQQFWLPPSDPARPFR